MTTPTLTPAMGASFALLLTLLLSPFAFGQTDLCSDSALCDPSGFCNFDFENSGFCEPCRACPDCRRCGLPEGGEKNCLDSCSNEIESEIKSESDEQCSVFFTGYDSYLELEGPHPISCGSAYGDGYGSSAFQSRSCCTPEGRSAVMAGQSGGFDYSWGTYVETVGSVCNAYVQALSATLCNPSQGRFVVETRVNGVVTKRTLRICQSACVSIFEACGPPGKNFPEWAEYLDAASLCYDMFGSFGYSSCQGKEQSPVCKSNLTLLVVEDECLDIVTPNEEDIESIETSDFLPDACARAPFVSVVEIVAPILFLCGFVIYSVVRKRRLKKTENLGVTGQEFDDDTYAVAEDDGDAEIAAPTKKNGYSNEVGATAVATTLSKMIEGVQEILVTPLKDTKPSLAEYIDASQSYDKKEAIKQWMKENPSLAASLSPNAMSESLSKITFSLDQPSCAVMIAQGIAEAGGSVTCAHIIAAVKTCTLVSTDVAKELAPHAVDPENKTLVLKEFTFEKEEVARAFR